MAGLLRYHHEIKLYNLFLISLSFLIVLDKIRHGKLTKKEIILFNFMVERGKISDRVGHQSRILIVAGEHKNILIVSEKLSISVLSFPMFFSPHH